MIKSYQLTGLATLVHREVRRFLRIWPQTLMPPAITMTLYFVVFGSLLGRQLEDVGGFSYMQFIVPGLIMMSVITNSYANVSSSFYSSKFSRHIEELYVAPVPAIWIVTGFVFGGMCRGLVTGVIVSIIGSGFTDLSIKHPGLIVLVMLLTSCLFATAGLINGIMAEKFDDVSIVPTFVLTPLTYLGGVFYSIKLLPEFWQTVSLLNPILYMINAFRYGFLGMADIEPLWALAMMSVFVVALFGLAVVLVGRGYRIRT